MNFLTGTDDSNPRIVLYGPVGIGKSTFASQFPASVAADVESGMRSIGTPRVELHDKGWVTCLSTIQEMILDPGQHQTIIVDTADRLEEKATAAVLNDHRKKSLIEFKYGDGFEAVAQKWRELIFVLDKGREKGRTVIVLAHVASKRVNDPTLGEYEQFTPAIGRRLWSATEQWADHVFFARRETILTKDGIAVVSDQRQLCTEAATGYVAKNRWNLPPVLKLEYSELALYREKGTRAAGEIERSILELVKASEIEAKVIAAIATTAGDRRRLLTIEKAAEKKILEMKGQST